MSTTTMASHTAASTRTLATAELLEMILLVYPTKEITRARQVSSFFKNVIDNSHPLRQEMFLEPCAYRAEPYFKYPFHDGTITYLAPNLHPLFLETMVEDDETCLMLHDQESYLGIRFAFDVQQLLSWTAPGMWEEILINSFPSASIRLFCESDDMGVELQSDASLGDLRRAVVEEVFCGLTSGGSQPVGGFLMVVNCETGGWTESGELSG